MKRFINLSHLPLLLMFSSMFRPTSCSICFKIFWLLGSYIFLFSLDDNFSAICLNSIIFLSSMQVAKITRCPIYWQVLFLLELLNIAILCCPSQTCSTLSTFFCSLNSKKEKRKRVALGSCNFSDCPYISAPILLVSPFSLSLCCTHLNMRIILRFQIKINGLPLNFQENPYCWIFVVQ